MCPPTREYTPLNLMRKSSITLRWRGRAPESAPAGRGRALRGFGIFAAERGCMFPRASDFRRGPRPHRTPPQNAIKKYSNSLKKFWNNEKAIGHCHEIERVDQVSRRAQLFFVRYETFFQPKRGKIIISNVLMVGNLVEDKRLAASKMRKG